LDDNDDAGGERAGRRVAGRWRGAAGGTRAPGAGRGAGGRRRGAGGRDGGGERGGAARRDRVRGVKKWGKSMTGAGYRGSTPRSMAPTPLTRVLPPPGVGAKIYGADPPDTSRTTGLPRQTWRRQYCWRRHTQPRRQ
jgi:hypothetical protein